MSSSGLILSLSRLGVLAGVMPVTDLLSAAAGLGVAEPAGISAPPGVMPPDHATHRRSSTSTTHPTSYSPFITMQLLRKTAH